MLRRNFITGLAAGTAGLTVLGRPGLGLAQVAAPTTAPAPAAPPAPPVFTLPPLGYGYEALEPHIDTATMRIHHSGHHQAYVTNANALVAQWDGLKTTPIETVLADLNAVPENVRTGVRNNVGGHWNHSFFWDLMTPGGAKQPSAELRSAMEASIGSTTDLVTKLNAAAMGRFGSGWAWLVVDKDKKIAIISTANQDTPLELGAKPVLGVDVWEHAYYLKHQSRRAAYLTAWWQVVNWDKANENFKKAMA
ncbi:superoxide dismutase [Bosea sp. Leaf344]|uniref:superoxide dismutase n=1 Tax=Bosea sp. Leaf344 TaxID=1736346 RepID=UPI0009EBD2AE|nr:superoxide dismutase [Bosea sp. Leaf344]